MGIMISMSCAGTVLIKNADELLSFSNEEEARLEEVWAGGLALY